MIIKIKIAFVSISLFASIFCMDFYRGGFQGSYFLQSPDARGISLAGSHVTMKDNPFSAFYNPALLAKKTTQWHLGLAYSSLSLDRSIQSITIGSKVPPGAGVAFSVMSVKVGEITGRSYFGYQTEKFDWSEHRAILSFGLNPTDLLSVGVNLNVYLHQSIDEVSSSGMGIDGGLFLELNEQVTGSFTVKNLLAKSNWKIDMSDGTTRDYSESFPLIFSSAIKFNPLDNLNSFFQLDYFYQMEMGYVGTDFRTGIEYYTRKITIRSGLWNKKPAIGFGLPLNQFYSRLDYALLPGMEGEGLSHIFTWVFEK